MARVSPLRTAHEEAGATFMVYGPAEADVRVPASFAELELEYASIRKHAALLDQPQRGTLLITGTDRIEFLNRMVTQELRGLGAGDVRRSFWLNRKGRIDADLRLIELGDRMLVDVDVLAAGRTVKGLTDFVITEDVTIGDASESMHHLGLHGPQAIEVLQDAGLSDPPEPGHAVSGPVAGREVIVFREDACAEKGFEILAPAEHAPAVRRALLRAGSEGSSGRPTVREIGWHAYNIARIEAGTPLYQIDFGPESLPHETGVIADRVSFKKGCYLGQEVVARMESRGHSKRTLVALRCEAPAGPSGASSPLDAPQPVSGSQIFATEAPDAAPIGVVTSSTPSPRHSLAVICFAAVKPEHRAPGTRLLVEAEGMRLVANVQPTLSFLHGVRKPPGET